MNEKVKNINGNIFWKFCERVGTQLVSVIVSFILARILTPNEFGIVAIVMAFITFFNVIVTCGLGSSLIQKENVNNIDYSSVFYVNLGVGVICYIFLFVAAPLIADIYENKELVSLIRSLGVLLPLSSINSVQQSYVVRNMMFKKFFKSTFIGSAISGIVGIVFAFWGFGVWALVFQYIINNLINTIVLWFTVRWRPDLTFSYVSLKNIVPLGFKLLLEKLIQNGYLEIVSLLLGKKYVSSQLAYYNRAQQFPRLFVNNLSDSMGTVLFSVMSRIKNDKTAVLGCLRKYLKYAMYIIIPLLFGLMAISRNIILVILSDKWLGCVPYMYAFCIYYLFEPIHSLNCQVYKAFGRGDTIVKLQLVRAIFNIVVLAITVRYSVMAVTIGTTIINALYWIAVASPNKKLIGYGFLNQVKDVYKMIFIGIIMFFITFLFRNITTVIILNLLIQIMLGFFLYIIFSIIFKIDEYINLLNEVIIKRRRRLNRY